MTQGKFSVDIDDQLNATIKMNKRMFEPAGKKDAQYLARMSKGEVKLFSEMDFVTAFANVQTSYNETDATILDMRPNSNGLLINENIQGSIARDAIVIHERSAYGVHENIDYWTVIEGGSGNDVIINNHQDSSGDITQMVRAVGGQGVDHYVDVTGGTESFMAVMGMEAGETLTVASQYTIVSEPLDGYFQIQSANGEMKADLVMDGTHTLMQLNDQYGNNVFVCVPEG